MNHTEVIKSLFADSYVEINKNHDEALDVMKKYCDKTRKKLPIIVNYDTHSDIYINCPVMLNKNLGNWVNHCFAEFDINEFYWIIPEYIFEEESEEVKEEDMDEDSSDEEKLNAGFNLLLPEKINEINKIEFLYNIKTRELITQEKIKHINSKCKKFRMDSIVKPNEYLKVVNVYILPLNKIDILKNKEITLSIDADAFCNTGHDTKMLVGNPWIDIEQLEKEYDKLLNALYENKIYPVCVSLTRSPGYFPKKYENNLMAFFDRIKNAGIDTIIQ